MGSKYGIAYTDGTERITQLNRPVENNLMAQVEYLTNLLYSQLGITQGVLDGSADDKTMNNYYNRTIEPILSAIVEEMRRKFLTKTARSQRQTILYFRDPFKLVPVSEIPEFADKLTRNEVMTSNDVNYFLRTFFREGIPCVFRRNPRLFRRQTPYLGILAFFTVR